MMPTVRASPAKSAVARRKQTIQSNADQAATYRKWVEERTNLPCEFIVISGTGSGERLDRDELELVENLVRAGDIDIQIFPPGYIKPEPEDDVEVKDSDVRKDPAWDPIYDKWFELLEDGASFSEVGDWLNAQGLTTTRGNRWTCASVSRVTQNPILKGVRRRNVRKSRRVNMTGRRKSVKADPSELLERECPHLAFIAPERYDRVLKILKARNSKFGRKKVTTVGPGTRTSAAPSDPQQGNHGRETDQAQDRDRHQEHESQRFRTVQRGSGSQRRAKGHGGDTVHVVDQDAGFDRVHPATIGR